MPGANNGFHLLYPLSGETPNAEFQGDYASRNTTAIRFRARHTGDGDGVVLRAVLFDDFGDGLDWVQTQATVTIPPTATGWHDYTLSLREGDLTSGGQNGLPVSIIRAAVVQLGLRHDPAGDGPGNPAPVARPTSVWFDDLTLVSEPRAGAVQMFGQTGSPVVLTDYAMYSAGAFRCRYRDPDRACNADRESGLTADCSSRNRRP